MLLEDGTGVPTGRYHQWVAFDGGPSLAAKLHITYSSGAPNNPPQITSTAITSAIQDVLYTYDVEATDPDVGDVLTFSLDASPVGMTIDAVSGLIQWTPTSSQVGPNNAITVRAEDPGQLFGTQTFTVTVVLQQKTLTMVANPPEGGSTTPSPGDQVYDYGTVVAISGSANPGWTFTGWSSDLDCNDGSVTMFVDRTCTANFEADDGRPVITSAPVTTATQDVLYTYDVEATDPDVGDVLTFSLDASPVGMTIDAVSGLIQWTPTSSQAGDHAVTVRAEDPGQLFDTQTFTVTVVLQQKTLTMVANPPEGGSTTPSPGDQVYDYGTVVAISASANAGWTFTGWSSDLDCNDGSVTMFVDRTCTANFEADNGRPVITSVPVTSATQDVLYTYDVEATDPDVGDVLTFSLDASPVGMTIDAVSGLIQWTPDNSQVGPNNAVTVRVQDPDGLSDTQAFAIDVAPAGPPSGEVDAQVAAGSDDAYHIPAGWPGYSDSKSAVYAGAPGSGPAWGGWRWTSLGIPAGATITEAYVELNQSGWGYNMTTTLAFEDSPNPATFSGASTPYDRWANHTTIEVDWAWPKKAPGTWIQTPSLVAIIQELVDTHGAIDTVVLLEDGTGVPTGRYHQWVAFEGGPSLAAKLHIAYSSGASNNPPQITSTAITSATQDVLYTYDVEATDPDVGDVLTFSLDASPVGMTIDAVSGLIQWTPTSSQTGDHAVTVRAEDPGQLFDTQTFTVTVVLQQKTLTMVANPPEGGSTTPSPGDQVYDYGTVVAISSSANAGWTFTGWSSDLDCNDGSVTMFVDRTCTANFEADDGRPVITSVPVTSATQDVLYTYDVEATDPDVGDVLTFSLDASPVGMTIDAVSGLIQWTPTSSQVGPNNAVTVRVQDLDGLSDTQAFAIDVAPAAPPSGEVDAQVAAGSDDAYHVPAGWPGYSDSKSAVYAGAPGSGPAWGGWRWTSLGIPAGATITEAYVELNQSGWGYNMTTTLAFEDSPNPATFSGASTPYDRWANHTTLEVDWAWPKKAPGTWIQTPSLVAIIQELVDTHGAIDTVVLLEDGTGVPTGRYHQWVAFEGGPSLAAKLHITYSSGA